MARMTDREAFDAMREFLARHYRRTGADEIGGLLGDLELVEDGRPADAALYDEWKACVSAVRAAHSHKDDAE